VSLDALPAAERERLLTLMGIDRWVLRGAAAASGNDPGRDIAAPDSRPAPLPPEAAPVSAPRLAIVAGETMPLAGRHGAMLRHLLRTLAIDEAQVTWSVHDGVPVLAFGAAPGDAADAVLAPPLATLRASGAARRSLWPALRTLRRRLREVR